MAAGYREAPRNRDEQPDLMLIAVKWPRAVFYITLLEFLQFGSSPSRVLNNLVWSHPRPLSEDLWYLKEK